MNISEALLHALKERGVHQIFGIPGDFALPFFAVVEKSAILPLYTLSHEPAVGFAADATARGNCILGAAAVTYGAGARNFVLGFRLMALAHCTRRRASCLSSSSSSTSRIGSRLTVWRESY